MSRQTDLHQLIIDDHGLIKSYVAIFQSSNDPRELLRAKQQLLDLWPQAVDHLTAYRRLVDPLPGDIAFIAQYIDAGIPPDILAWQPKDEDFTRRPRLPLQRPPRADHFTDRRAELDQLLADLQPGRVVTLCGPGGIGKTALAAEAIWSLAPDSNPPDRFPDGVLFHSFYGRPDPALALEHIALSFGEDPRPTPVDAALRALAGRCALLILDGTEQADDLGMVLDVRGGCGVLVTSRARKDALAERQDVRPLPPDDAADLLCKWGGDCAADAQATRQICEWVGRLPLAVRLAGRYLAETGERAADYLAWLREMPLDALDHGQRRQESVPVLLEKSLAQVGDAARQVLAVVGVLALTPFDRAPVAAALDAPANHLRQALNELTRYGLLERDGERYVVSHALVHTYARERCAPPGEVIERLAAYYDALAREQSALGPEGYHRLDGERAHLMRVLNACIAGERWESARSLVWAVKDYLDICGYWTERVQALEQGVLAAQALNHRRDEGAFMGKLGNAYADLGQVESDGTHPSAIEHYQAALTISREIGDRRGEGNHLGNLGIAYYSLGQVESDGTHPSAIEHYQAALTIAREIGDRRNQGTWLGSLGLAYAALGQVESDGAHPSAIEHYQAALTISREIGDRQNQGTWLGNLGSAYYSLGQVEKAIEHYQAALTISREIGDRRNQGTWLGNLGNAYYSLGQVEKAIEYHQQALVISREIGDRRGEGSDLGNLGLAYAALGQVEKAIEHYQAALTISREIGDRRGEGNHLGNLGNAYRNLGQVEKAIEHYQAALTISGEIGDRRNQGTWLGNLGNAYRNLGQVEKAIEHYQAALTISREIGDRRSEGNHLGNLGNAYAALGQVEKAIECMSRSAEIFEEIKSPNAALVRGWLEKLQQKS